MNTLQNSGVKVLSNAEIIKYSKFRLPLIPCPSCGESHKGSLLNLGFNRNCVSCGDGMELKEISEEGLKKLEYIKLNIKKIEDQKLIARFRDNILWMCSHCGKGNLNLKKNKHGNPTSGRDTNCEGCGSEYLKGVSLLPFMPLRNFGFDDGNDSDDTYELSMLFKTQGLWFECIKKALIDGGEDEVKKLFKKLTSKKRTSPTIPGNRRKLKDGRYAISFMLKYLGVSDGNYKDVSFNTSGTMIEESAQLFETIELTKYDVAKTLGTNWKIFTPIVMGIGLGISAIIDKTHDITIEGAYHDSSFLFQEKGTLSKKYHLERHEPELDFFENVIYRIDNDTTGLKEFIEYRGKSDFYHLKLIGGRDLVKGQIVELDTGRDKKITTPNDCPKPSTSSSSSGNYSSSGSSSSGGGSSGVGFGGGGSLFMGPKGIEIKDKIIKPEGEVIDRTFQASVTDRIIGIITMSGNVHAGDCDIITHEDIVVEAYIKYLIQRYTVWDWQDGQTESTGKIKGLHYEDSLRSLKKELIEDNKNQKVSSPQTKMYLRVFKENGKPKDIRYKNRNDWVAMDSVIEKNCRVEKSYLTSFIMGVTEEDVKKQCTQ